MFDLYNLDKVTGIVSDLTIIVAMISLIFQLRQNRIQNKLAYKDRFVTCTSRYIKIQEILLSTECLNHINVGIYKNRVATISEGEAISLGKELALCAMIFQLMEDVWTTHDLETDKDSDSYSGWKELFKDWMNTPEIAAHWPVLKHHFGRRFVADIEQKYIKRVNSNNTKTHEKVGA